MVDCACGASEGSPVHSAIRQRLELDSTESQYSGQAPLVPETSSDLDSARNSWAKATYYVHMREAELLQSVYSPLFPNART